MKKLLLFIFAFGLFKFSFSQTGKEFTDFDIKGSTLKVHAVSMKVEDKETKKIVFDGYKEGDIVISNVSANPFMTTVDINLGGYFKMEIGEVYSVNVEYKDTWTSVVTYTLQSGEKMASLTFYYTNSVLKSLWIITIPDIKHIKKGLIVTLSGIELTSDDRVKLKK